MKPKDLITAFGPLHFRWIPFCVGALFLFWQGVTGQFTADLFHVFLVVVTGAAFLAGKSLYSLSALMVVIALPLSFHFFFGLPGFQRDAAMLPPGTYLRVEGTVRTFLGERGASPLRLILGAVTVKAGEQRWELPELVVELPAKGSLYFRLFRKTIRVGGRLKTIKKMQNRAFIQMEGVEFHVVTPPITPYGMEWMAKALKNRAAYYLGGRELAVYLPVVLGVRERPSAEGRAVMQAFRRVGISHLFAISGLHIGLLYLLFFSLSKGLGIFFLRHQGGVWGKTRASVISLVLIWAYIALLGFPVPAVRAALMGSMVVWSGLWGTRTPRGYVLTLAALVLLLYDPSILYDISFQLSFLAYLFLLRGMDQLTVWQSVKSRTSSRRAGLIRDSIVGNLTMTLFITLGLWPVVAFYFEKISLLVFLGNLVMIPLLSVLVLPSGMLAFLVSLGFLGASPGHWLERSAFGLLEWVLKLWIWVVEKLDMASGFMVFATPFKWTPAGFFFYYLLLFGGMVFLKNKNKRWSGWGKTRFKKV